MNFIALIGALVALVVVIMILRRRRRRRKAATQEPAAVPVFRVVTLGLQGSGKTLLLTSMFRSLQVPGDRGFYVTTPRDQRMELNRWYREVASPDVDWPQGTVKGEMREFEFSLMTHIGDEAHPVLQLNYLEYPGELLTERDDSPAQDRLFESIGSADALIGIIDGLRVRQAYHRDSRGLWILQSTLDTMIGSMIGARSPIAFVITKWDLLDDLHPDEDVRLSMVRNVLMSNEGFRDLVRLHSGRRVVRLVPVTAVGHDFAVLEEGSVRKKTAGHFQPSNADVPLSAVVPDVIAQVELALDRTAREAVLAEARRYLRQQSRDAFAALGTFALQAAGTVLAATLPGAVGQVANSGLAMFLDTQLEPKRQHRLTEVGNAAEDLIRARRRVVASLQSRVNVLEARLPSSRLGG